MTRRRATWFLVVLAACLVFAADNLTPADVSVSVLYVTIIMIVLRIGALFDLIAAGVGCLLLTTFSFVLTPAQSFQYNTALLNYALSLFAISSTTYLGIRVLIVERKARWTREEVARTSRGLSLSELTSSIAHEINQPLAAIVANSAAARRWLAMLPPDISAANESIESVVSNGERAGAIVNSLKRLVSTSTPLRSTFDLAQLVTETIELVEIEATRSGTSVQLHVGRGLPLFVGDPTLIQQLVLNLLSNSLDAVRHAGSQNAKVAIDVSASKDAIVLKVSDAGGGTDPDALQFLFTPFYSTKQSGMGVGLAICRSIVEAHGGSIAAINEKSGMTFEVNFPRQIVDNRSST